jgi:hypothetical protein
MSFDNELDQAKKLKKELIEAKKNKGKKGEPLISDEEIENLRPKTFGQKFENFWYHNSLKVFAVVLVLIISVATVYSIVSREKFDYTVLFVTSEALDKEAINYANAIKAYGVDVNGDNKVTVNVIPLAIVKETELKDIDFYLAVRSKLTAEIVSREISIFILDDYIYNMIEANDQQNKSAGMFADLNTIAKNENINKDRFLIKGSHFDKTLNFKHPDDYTISIRPTAVVKSDKKIFKQYQKDTELIKRIIKGERTDKKTK